MKYLRRIDEAWNTPKYVDQSIIDTINDICWDLNDLGFYRFTTMGEKIPVKLKKTDLGNCSEITFHKDSFYFDDISHILYRIKDVVGIENISAFNYMIKRDSGSFSYREYTRCNLVKLGEETLNIKSELESAFIVFNFFIE